MKTKNEIRIDIKAILAHNHFNKLTETVLKDLALYIKNELLRVEIRRLLDSRDSYEDDELIDNIIFLINRE